MVYKLEIGGSTTIKFNSKDEIIAYLLGEVSYSSGDQLKLIYPKGSYYLFEGEEIDWTE